MHVAVAREDIDFIPIDTERGFFDALTKLIDPFRFSGECIEAIEVRRIARTNVDAARGDGRRGKPAAILESPVDLGRGRIDAVDSRCGRHAAHTDAHTRRVVGAVLEERRRGVEVGEVPSMFWVLIAVT